MHQVAHLSICELQKYRHADQHTRTDSGGKNEKGRARRYVVRRGRRGARRSVALRPRRDGPVCRGSLGRRGGHGDLRLSRVSRGPSGLKFKGSALSFVHITSTFTYRGSPGLPGGLPESCATFTMWHRSSVFVVVVFPVFVSRFAFLWWSFFDDPAFDVSIPEFPRSGRAFPVDAVSGSDVFPARCVE